MAEATRPRFPWVLTVLSGLVFVLLVSLGVWQAQRLQWKQGLIAQAEAAAALPPASAAEVLAAADPEFRKMAIECPGLATAPYVELQTIHEGQAGVRLISACRPVGVTETFLVDRGFVADVISARPPVSAAGSSTTVIAQVRETPPPGAMALPRDKGRFFARDNAGIARALGVTGASRYTLFATTSTNPEWRALRPSAPPAAFSNNHLGYAITWFGLALALAGFYVAMIRRKPAPQQPRPASEATGKEESS